MLKENLWQHQVTGDPLMYNFYDLAPDLPGSFADFDGMRRGLARHVAHRGDGLVEAELYTVDGLPMLWRIEKMRHPRQEQAVVYAGSYTVPRRECSATLSVLCEEKGTTGGRDAAILPRHIAQGGSKETFAAHPYVVGLTGGVPRTVADDPEYDAEFPLHPLSRARQTLSQLALSLRVAPTFKSLPAFD